MKSELLALAAVDALIALNSGVVHAEATAKFSVTTGAEASQIITVCKSGCDFTDPHAAVRSVAGDYSKDYIFQLGPGVYDGSGIGVVDSNGEIVGMGATRDDVVIQASSTAPQALLRVGSVATPYPGANFRVHHISFNGTLANGTKQDRCIQLQSVGVIEIDDVHIHDCQMGIMGQPWSPSDGSGVIIISGNQFTRNGSNKGPSHPIYLGFGTLCVGACNLTVNGTTYAGTGNIIQDVAYGYGTKSRALVTLVEGNIYNLGTVLSGSGAVHIAEGGTAYIADNIMNYGSLTGTNSQPGQGVLLGGTLGQFFPWAIHIEANQITLSGVTKPFTPVSSLMHDPAPLVVNNTLPHASEIDQGQIISGPGTIGAGNHYADGSPVPESVQNASIMGSPVLADYRGDSDPHSLTITTKNDGQTVRGGDGLLTVTMDAKSNSAYVVGGRGGVDFAQVMTSNAAWLWTDPGSISNKISLTSGFQTFDFGQHDSIVVGGTLICGGSSNPINVLGGTTTVSFDVTQGTTQNPYCSVKSENATVNVIESYWSSKNQDNMMEGWPNSVINVSGRGVRPTMTATDSIINVNDLELVPSSGPPMVFNHEIVGGGVVSGPKVVAGSGMVQSMSGWEIDTYNSAKVPAVIRLKEKVSVAYTLPLVGGGTVFAGIDKVTVTGSSQFAGPAPFPIVLHVEGAAAGSTTNVQFSPQSVFLDGPGTVKVQRANSSTQPARVELDTNGSGSIEVAQPWRDIDVCVLNGVGITSEGTVGANYVIHTSAGGTAQFDGMAKTGVRCAGGRRRRA